MALITDPDLLNQSAQGSAGTPDGEVFIDTSTKTIELIEFGNLSADGVTLKALYSFLKEEWRADASLIRFDFPMTPITDESMQIGVSSRNNGWVWLNAGTRKLIRTGGWQEVSDTGVVLSEWAGIISLGSLTPGTQPYYEVVAGTPTNFTYAGPVNEAVEVYSAPSESNFDYRSLFNVFAREQGDVYAGATLADIGVSTMTFQVFRFPLSTSADAKIVTSDGDITTLAPYTGMSISYRSDPLTVEIGSGLFYDFGIVIDGNNGTAEQIYEFVQYQLRQNSDINEGEQLIAAQDETNYAASFAGGTGHAVSDIITLTNGATITVDAVSGGVVTQFTVTTTGPAIEGETILQASTTGTGIDFSITTAAANLEQSTPDVTGRTADLLLQFVGDTLFTREAFNPATSTVDGVYITNFQASDINRLVFTDDTGTERVFPFTATLTLNFSATLQNDADAKYWVFFTNDDAGDNTGRDFNTSTAILVNDADGLPMTGDVSSQAFVQLTYAYDTNDQRGAASTETDAPVTAVALGLSGAQYVLATGTIARSNANTIALVAPQERNYDNPI
jgi:hypothetical protein